MSIFDKKEQKKMKILCNESQNFEKPQICGFRKKGLKIRKGSSKTAGFAENRKVWSHCVERGAERSCQASNKFDEVSAATPCEFSQFLPI